jgi:C4-dicarboxylate-specific signal transduction histidine kinase
MKTKKYFSIQKKILIGILGISTVVTSVLTIASFYLDYKEEISGLESMFSQIEMSSVPSLATALWDFDDTKISAQIEGLYSLYDVVAVKVTDPEAKVLAEKNRKIDNTSEVVKVFPVYYSEGSGKKRMIGNLEVVATKQHLYERLIRRVITFFLTQLLKATLVSTLFFLFVQAVVTSRLKRLRLIMTKAKLDDISVDSKWFKQKDEINDLFESYQAMDKQNKELIESQGEELQIRQASAIESARLAALGEMASGVAHEINNPLAIIHGSALLMKGQLDKPYKKEIYLKQIDRIEKMVFRAKHIVDSMKLSARDGSDDPIEFVALSQILDDCIILSEARMAKMGVEFKAEFGDMGDLTVAVRRAQFSQVMVNLLNNAVDAVSTINEKWIRLEARFDEKNVYLDVIDSGSGITPELREKIFRPFFTTKGVGKGTGLGLSLSRKIVKEFKGDLDVDQSYPYTKFVISLPFNLEKQNPSLIKTLRAA